MKHLTFSSKSMLTGDATADALIEYAALLVQRDSADSVDVHVFNSDGDESVAKILLSAGAPLMAESTHSSLPEPDNVELLSYLRERISLFESPPTVMPEDGVPFPRYDDLEG